MKLKQKKLAKWAVLPAVAVCAAAIVPGHDRTFLHSTGDLHPYYHFGIFAAIAWLAAWSTRSTRKRLWLCAAVIVLGCTTEIIEWSVYNVPLEWGDMLLDALGAVIGTGLGALTKRAPKPALKDSARYENAGV